MRALGIPSAIDIYVYSPDLQGAHQWNVVKDTTEEYVPFWYIETAIQRGNSDHRKKGKVYRKCFGIQAELYPGIREKKQVPALFRELRQKDVTSDYFGENKVEIIANRQYPEQYAYLGVFSPRGWQPVAIGEMTGNKAIFHNLEASIVFQPICITGKEIQYINYPFRMDQEGKIDYFIPDTLHTTSLVINRKYTLSEKMFNNMCKVIGAYIEGSMDKDFGHPELLHQINDTPRINFCTVYPSTSGPFRYVRFHSAKDKPVQLAELFLYDEHTADKSLPTQIKDASRAFRDNERENKDKANDGNILTYYLSQDSNAYIIYDLGKPKHIKKLVYVPRNDDNFVRIGETYKLFYQNGRQGWSLLDTQKATDTALHFDQVPQNALFWLHTDKGKEERIFIVREGKACFL